MPPQAQGSREGSAGLAELVGVSLRDHVADLVRGGGGESPQLLEARSCWLLVRKFACVVADKKRR